MKVQALEVWFFTVIATCRAAIPVFKTSSDINQATKKTALTHFNIKSADTQSATETLVLQKALPHTDTLIPISSLLCQAPASCSCTATWIRLTRKIFPFPSFSVEEIVRASSWGKLSCLHLVSIWRNHETVTSAKLDTSFPLLHRHQHVPASSTISQGPLTAFCLRLHWLGCEVLTQVR